jgi:hypothetical protein
MVKIPWQFDRVKYPIIQFNGIHSVVVVEHLNTNRLLSVEHFDISSDTVTYFGRLRPSSDHYYNILKKGTMQYKCIRRTLSLSGITKVYNNY